MFMVTCLLWLQVYIRCGNRLLVSLLLAFDALNEKTSVCLLYNSVWIRGPHCRMNGHNNANFGLILQPNRFVKFRLDFIIHFKTFTQMLLSCTIFHRYMQGYILTWRIPITFHDSLEFCLAQLELQTIWLFNSRQFAQRRVSRVLSVSVLHRGATRNFQGGMALAAILSK